jgi:hypothetical protein
MEIVVKFSNGTRKAFPFKSDVRETIKQLEIETDRTIIDYYLKVL